MSMFTVTDAARQETVARVLQKHHLTHMMIVNPGCGNWNQWLLGGEAPGNGPPNPAKLPTLAPFNRNSGYIVSAEGDVYAFSAGVPHPTDSAQYPLFSAVRSRPAYEAGRIGLINPEYLRQTTRQAMRDEVPAVEFVDLTAELEAARAVKPAGEAEELRKAAAVYDRAFSAVKLTLRSGRSEHDAVADFRFRLANLGASTQDLGLLTAVQLTSAPQNGKSVTGPLQHPGRILQNGDRVNLCVNGYVPGGYAAALGRCCVAGEPTGQTRADWALAVQAQHLAAELARPGASIQQIAWQLHTQLLEPAGMELEARCWMYGIGAYRCEAPRSSDATAAMPLQAGMVLAIGPAVCRPGEDAYCCMDVYQITETGGVRLSGTAQDLIILP